MWIGIRSDLRAIMAVVGMSALLISPASATDKVTFLTSWFAQAEHGGFYQAKATGLYERAGLDATIKMGGRSMACSSCSPGKPTS